MSDVLPPRAARRLAACTRTNVLVASRNRIGLVHAWLGCFQSLFVQGVVDGNCRSYGIAPLIKPDAYGINVSLFSRLILDDRKRCGSSLLEFRAVSGESLRLRQKTARLPRGHPARYRQLVADYVSYSDRYFQRLGEIHLRPWRRLDAANAGMLSVEVSGTLEQALQLGCLIRSDLSHGRLYPFEAPQVRGRSRRGIGGHPGPQSFQVLVVRGRNLLGARRQSITQTLHVLKVGGRNPLRRRRHLSP